VAETTDIGPEEKKIWLKYKQKKNISSIGKQYVSWINKILLHSLVLQTGDDLLLCSGKAERTPHALCLYGPALSSCQADSGHVPTQQSEASLDTIPSSRLV
jgi:hypothetical protein